MTLLLLMLALAATEAVAAPGRTVAADTVDTVATPKSPVEKSAMEFRVILPTLTGTVTGQVFDAASRRCQPAVVSFKGDDSGDVFIDSSGVFALIGFPVGTYRFCCASANRRYAGFEREVVLYSTDTLHLEFPLVELEGIRFPEGEKYLDPVYHAGLDSLGRLLVRDSTLTLEIDGFTDSTTIRHKYPSNLALSRARADEVKNYLKEKFRLPDRRFVTAGFGVSAPVASNETEVGRSENRRVEFKFIARRDKPQRP